MITLLVNLTACKKAEKEIRYDSTFLELFDTVTEVVGYAKDKEEFTKFSQTVYDELKTYHELYDIYNTYDGINNIKTINDNAGIQPVKVDQKIIDLIKFAEDAYELTDGQINIAFGAVLEVWHKYRSNGIEDPRKAQLPPMELLQEKSEHTDINKIIIDEVNSTVYLEDPEMSLDVGAIAKGYATEMVAQYLIKNGCKNTMLSVGGNVRTIGTKSKSENNVPWNVGIQNPDMESDQKNLYILELDDRSLVTSGDYQRYYVVDGKKYHHIIDLETLMPSDYFTAVSIVTTHSGLADALSTAIFNMPYEEGLALIESMDDTEALWVFKDGQMKYSSHFEDYIHN
ncbi:MAG: ApbE family lipoprotein [Anaerocolumna sp.]|jgi:thiamine biosynthesis lipoprotein|nr:ApbE family lipoprotein [Anaerocolumna sp.]